MKVKIVRSVDGTCTPLSGGKSSDTYLYKVMAQQILQHPGEELVAENLGFDSPELSRYRFLKSSNSEEIPLEGLKDALESERGIVLARER